MGEAKDIQPGVYELQLGTTFDSHPSDKTTYHTLKYDFKPKSVAAETESYMAVGANGDVQVAVPGEAESLTVYKGASKPVKADKECLLFFNPATGTVRLEKLASNISVKKTRDIDAATENLLKSKISRLRTHSSAQKKRELVEEPVKTTKTVKERASSSSSSSSSSSLSSDSEEEQKETFKERQPNHAEEEGRDNWGGESDEDESGNEDEEMQRQLEKAMTSSTPLPVLPEKPVPSDSHVSSNQSLGRSFSANKNALINDLALSESDSDSDSE